MNKTHTKNIFPAAAMKLCNTVFIITQNKFSGVNSGWDCYLHSLLFSSDCLATEAAFPKYLGGYYFPYFKVFYSQTIEDIVT